MAKTYGWTDEYLNNLTCDVFQDYWLAIDVMISFDSMRAATNSSIHSWKEQDRKRYFKDLSRIQKSIIIDENEAELTTVEAANLLAKRMIVSGR